jgi:hypothetical protein
MEQNGMECPVLNPYQVFKKQERTCVVYSLVIVCSYSLLCIGLDVPGWGWWPHKIGKMGANQEENSSSMNCTSQSPKRTFAGCGFQKKLQWQQRDSPIPQGWCFNTTIASAAAAITCCSIREKTGITGAKETASTSTILAISLVGEIITYQNTIGEEPTPVKILSPLFTLKGNNNDSSSSSSSSRVHFEVRQRNRNYKK